MLEKKANAVEQYAVRWEKDYLKKLAQRKRDTKARNIASAKKRKAKAKEDALAKKAAEATK